MNNSELESRRASSDRGQMNLVSSLIVRSICIAGFSMGLSWAQAQTFDRADVYQALQKLDSYYSSQEGLQRPNGLSINGRPDFEAVAAWIFDVYLAGRAAGESRDTAWARVVSSIRQSHEWRTRHPEEDPGSAPSPVAPISVNRGEFFETLLQLDSFYASTEGLLRPMGLSINGKPDIEGIAAWVLDVYLNARLKGRSRMQAWNSVRESIWQSAEWIVRHTPSHKIWFGYYYSDGRYGDFTSEVSDFTNLYVADPFGYISESDWRPQFSESLQRASLNQKGIYLMISRDPAFWDEILSRAAPYWDDVIAIEVGHEEDINADQAEDRIQSFRTRLASRGLADRPFGVLLTRCQILDEAGCDGSSRFAPSLDWVGVEAYLDAPGSSESSVNVQELTYYMNQAKARVPDEKGIAIVMMSYDRNGTWTNLDTLADIQMPTFLNVFQDPRVFALTMFAYARPGGARDHSSLRIRHESMGAAILNFTCQPSYSESH